MQDEMIDMNVAARPVVVFDGFCILCSRSAGFILRNDARGSLLLTCAQRERGAALCRSAGVDPTSPETMFVIAEGRTLRQSEAVLFIASRLRWPWRAAILLRMIPAFIRDAAYRTVARNRYRVFGQRQTCWLPTADQADRVL